MTTVKASNATGTSINSMPASAHFFLSLAFMGLDAPEMTVSPRQNFFIPPPVPDTPTVTLIPVSIWNSSATASVIGYTVLEPSILIISTAAIVGLEKANVPAKTAAILDLPRFNSFIVR